MYPVIQIGSIAVQVPGLALLLGLWIALLLSEREAIRRGVNGDVIYNMAFAGLVGGLIGARLMYALKFSAAYIADPLSLVSLNAATLAVNEGIVIGVLVAMVYGGRKGLPLRRTLDSLAPGVAAMAIAIALAHAAGGDAFGGSARLPWSIYLWDNYRHPSQLYELASALIILAAWRKWRGRFGAEGADFVAVVGLIALSRLTLEMFRGDSVVWIGGLRVAQIGSLAVVLACLVMLRLWSGPDRVGN